MNDLTIYNLYKNKPLRDAIDKYMDVRKRNLDVPLLCVKNMKDLR